MAQVRVFLLGAPLIERDGAPVKFDRRKAIALLAFLALTGRRHQRDTLAALLWPEYDQQRAFAYLRRTLWALKAALGADVLQSDRDTVGLRAAGGLWIDVLAFRELLAPKPGRAHGDPAERQHDLNRLSAAVALYRGDLLAGFSVRESPEFDEWQIAQAEVLRQEVGAALEQLAIHSSAQGAGEQAITAARRWAVLDPLNEAAHCLLMELYARAGRRSAALRQYHECARLLQHALGVAPQPATTALYERIRSDTPDLGELGTGQEDSQYLPYATPQPSTSIPLPPTPLLGRDADVATVCERLRQPGLRLLTLIGPGGTGKTRLALQVARELSSEFADGVYFVELAALGDAALVVTTIAQALSVEQAPGQSLTISLQQALRFKQALLVLDNFEQVLDAAGLIGELLAAAPQLKVLVTSRMLLRLSGEHEFPVPPLALPPPLNSSRLSAAPQASQSQLATHATYPAVQLFTQRAQALLPDFTLTEANISAVTTICQRLDGLPLAIELAAARIRVFSPQTLLARLEDSHSAALQILTGGARDLPERQQTLRNTIDWSYNLLDAPEQVMFAQLAVFVGGCSLEAAEAVLRTERHERGLSEDAVASVLGPQSSVLDGLTSLVDNSLLRRETGADDEPRFGMLETIREYALERLEHSGTARPIRRRHAQYVLALATQSQRELVGYDQLRWLARLDDEIGNVRAALAFCLDRRDAQLRAGDTAQIVASADRPDSELLHMGLRLAAALWRWWYFSANIGEGRSWLDIALARSGEASAAQAQALLAAAALAVEQGDERAALPRYQNSMALWQTLGDQAGAARVLAHGSHVLAQGDRAAARHLASQSVSLLRTAGDPIELATALYNLAETANLAGDYAEAHALVEEGLALSRAAGDRWGSAGALIQLGYIASARSDYLSARTLFEESRALWRALDQRASSVGALTALGWIAWIQGAFDEVTAIFGETLRFAQERGDKKSADWALNRLGWAAWARGDLERATMLFEENWATALALGTRTRVAWSMSGLAHVAGSQGDRLWAASLFEQSLAAFRSSGYQVDINWALNNLGRALAGQGELERAASLFAEALHLSSQQNDLWNVAAALEGLATLHSGHGQFERAARLFGAAAALRDRIAVPIWPSLRAQHERATAVIRSHLGAGAFAAARAAGQALPLHQAIAEALG